MKPLYLHLVNVGPFRDEQIDFSALDDMFLVYGNTGSGKTTIFDAMTYALYGDLCGSRKKMVLDFASDFAQPDEKAFVEFTFDLYHKKYRITRTLPIAKSEKKKTAQEIIFEQEEPSESLFDASENFKRIEGNISELNAKIESLIGLSINEFTRIVLLPQGAFSQFLKEGSNNRRETLSKLFPIENYKNVMEKAKSKAGEYKDELKLIEKQITDLNKTYNPETAVAELDQLKNDLAKFEDEQEKLHSKTENQSAEIEQLRLKLIESNNALNLKKEEQSLEANKEIIKELEIKIEFAQKAEKISVYINQTKDAERKKNEAKIAVEKKQIEQTQQKQKFDELEAQKAEIEKKRTSLDSKKTLLAESSAQKQLLTQLLEDKKEYNSLLSKKNIAEHDAQDRLDVIEELKKQIFSNLPSEIKATDENEAVQKVFSLVTDANKKLVNAKEIFDSAKKKSDLSNQKATAIEKQAEIAKALKSHVELIDNAKKCLEDYEAQKKLQEQNNHALFLVASLKTGQPCPVCGSLEHPHVATILPESLDISDKIQTQNQIIQTLLEKKSQLERDETACQTNINQFDELIAELEKNNLDLPDLQTATQLFEDAKQKKNQIENCSESIAIIQKKINTQKKELEQFQSSVADASDKVSTCAGKIQGIENQLANYGEQIKDVDSISSCIFELVSKIENLSQTISSDESKIKSFDESYQGVSESLASIKSSLEILRENESTATKDYKNALEQQNKKVSESDFESAEQVISFVLSSEQIETYKTKVQTWADSVKNVKAKLESLKDVESVEKIVEAQNKANALLDELHKKSTELAGTIKDLTQKHTNLDSLITQAKSLESKRIDLQNTAAPYIKLSDDLEGHGSNAKKIPFDAWVLGMYFSEVVFNANPRFERISGGRYHFKINTQATGGNSLKGLDLLVTDSFTGKDRDTATLSGGETFMASISLALALTDVVQAQSGGIRLDSLFIDEGFGSLDGESLDMAISILQNIGESRTVGIISHVDSLLQAIPSRLEVEKTTDGSHIKIV